MKQRLNLALWAVMVPATIASIHMQDAAVFMISVVCAATFVVWPVIIRKHFRKGDAVTFLPRKSTPRDFISNSIRDGLKRAEVYRVTAVNEENGLIKVEGGILWHHPKQFFLSN